MISEVFLLSKLLLFTGAGEPGNPDTKASKAVTTTWEIDRNSGGVTTYVRWIEIGQSSRVRERKGVMIVRKNAEDVVRFLCEPRNSALWMAGIEENYCIKQVSSTEWYAYTLFAIPWPFEKRDLVSNYRLNNSAQAESITIDICSRENFIPGKPDITRLTDYTATWTITRLDEERVRISFSAIANTPPLFPRYIQDPVLARMFHNNLVNLKQLLEG